MSIFNSKFDFILDVNLKCFDVICECLQLKIDYNLTESYQESSDNDFRFLANARKGTYFQFEKYTQVFTEKQGYISNLSILDLLFNEGPNSENYLRKQILDY